MGYKGYKEWRDCMFFKRIFTESISHYSYMIGDGKELVVVDPQADLDPYLEIARRADMKISRILETHRNEDFLVGSRALSKLTGAKVYISKYEDLDYEYGERIGEGHSFTMGKIKIKVLHTPGHTLGHLSYAVYYEDQAYMVFCGDTIFNGDIGRIDFYGEDNLEKMAGKIYDSIFKKLFPLGDHVIMCSAHGPGSACGESIEDRPWTSLGFERKHNPKLQYKSREDFIEANAKKLFKPDYFTYMEEMNLKGIEAIDCNPNLPIKFVKDLDLDKEYVLDIREQNSYNKLHIPASIFMDKDNILNFINWIIPREADICILSDKREGLNDLYVDLKRIGYTGRISFLANGIYDWIKNNKTEKIGTINPREYEEEGDQYFIIDVRKDSEVEDDYGENGMILPMETIREDYKKIPSGKHLLLVCPTGIRSNIVASFLKTKDIDGKVLIGGLDSVKKTVSV